MSLEGVREAKFHIIPASAIIQYHPFTHSILQPYLGAGVSYLMFRGGVRTPYGTAAQPDHGALMTEAGVRYLFSPHWSLNSGVKFGPARSTAEIFHADGTVDKIDFHQLYVSTGIGFSF